jgi:hypothetical protein
MPTIEVRKSDFSTTDPTPPPAAAARESDSPQALIEEARQRARRRRLWAAGLAFLLIVGGVAVGLVTTGGSGSTGSRTPSGAEGGGTSVGSTRGDSKSSVVVTGVTGTLAPYDPMVASEGIPEENVAFTVYDPPTLGFFCDIQVRSSGKLVGTLQVGIGALAGHPASASESVPVQINGPTFDGSASDASVSCSPANAGLPVVVTSVTGVSTPGSPSAATGEWVDFTVFRPPSQGFVCNIQIQRSGMVVGGSAVSFGAKGYEHSASVRESVPLSVAGHPFAGSPKDAIVKCSPAFPSTPG